MSLKLTQMRGRKMLPASCFPVRWLVCLCVIVIVVASFSLTALSQSMTVQGRVILWTTEGHISPAEGSVTIRFFDDLGIDIPPILSKEKGRWDQTFPERQGTYSVEIEATSKAGNVTYVQDGRKKISIPYQGEGVEIFLYEPRKLRYELAQRARNIEGKLEEEFKCMRISGEGYARTFRCWSKAGGKAKKLAQDKAGKAIKFYIAADKAAPSNSIWFQLANLQAKVGMVCDASESFGNIDMSKDVPGTKDRGIVAAYHVEAILQCAKETPDPDKEEILEGGILVAGEFLVKHKVFNPESNNLGQLRRKQRVRILTIWLDFFGLFSKNKDEVVSVAEKIHSDPRLKISWQQFKKVAEKHFGTLGFQEELNSLHLAGNIKIVGEKLGRYLTVN